SHRDTLEAALLTSREVAMLIWACVLSLAALSVKPLRDSFGGLLHSLLSWKVMLPAALLVGWTAGTVLVLRAVGLWDVTDAKTTLVWLLLAGLPLVYSGIEASSKNNHWWTAARVQFKAVAFIEVVRDSHSFSLPIELLLFPLLLGLTVL